MNSEMSNEERAKREYVLAKLDEIRRDIANDTVLASELLTYLSTMEGARAPRKSPNDPQNRTYWI